MYFDMREQWGMDFFTGESRVMVYGQKQWFKVN